MQGRFSRRLIRHISRGIIASILLLALALGICGICIYNQGQVREIHTSESIAIISEMEPQEPLNASAQARLDRAIELYKNNYGRLLLLPGDASLSIDEQPAYAYLLRHGIDPAAIVLYPAQPGLIGHVQSLRSVSDERALRSILLLSDPTRLLRTLKVAQDAQLPAFGTAVQANAPVGTWNTLSALWDESWRYLGYLLFNQ